MLTELSGMDDDESVWGTTDLSFSIQTRSEDGNELVEKTYTFSHFPEADEWTFQEYEEERTENTKHIRGRQWRRSRKVRWDEEEVPDIDVPPAVLERLEEALDLDELILSKP